MLIKNISYSLVILSILNFSCEAGKREKGLSSHSIENEKVLQSAKHHQKTTQNYLETQDVLNETSRSPQRSEPLIENEQRAYVASIAVLVAACFAVFFSEIDRIFFRN